MTSPSLQCRRPKNVPGNSIYGALYAVNVNNKGEDELFSVPVMREAFRDSCSHLLLLSLLTAKPFLEKG